MVIIKPCLNCFGLGKVCVGIKEDFTPLLEDCYDCKGRGWIICPVCMVYIKEDL